MTIPTGKDTMHMVHLECPGITSPDAEVQSLCGATTNWVDGDALKCPICIDLMFKQIACPMCGAVLNVIINP